MLRSKVEYPLQVTANLSADGWIRVQLLLLSYSTESTVVLHTRHLPFSIILNTFRKQVARNLDRKH